METKFIFKDRSVRIPLSYLLVFILFCSIVAGTCTAIAFILGKAVGYKAAMTRVEQAPVMHTHYDQPLKYDFYAFLENEDFQKAPEKMVKFETENKGEIPDEARINPEAIDQVQMKGETNREPEPLIPRRSIIQQIVISDKQKMEKKLPPVVQVVEKEPSREPDRGGTRQVDVPSVLTSTNVILKPEPIVREDEVVGDSPVDGETGEKIPPPEDLPVKNPLTNVEAVEQKENADLNAIQKPHTEGSRKPFFTIQVASFVEQGQADNYLKKMKKIGYEAYSQRYISAGKVFFRVRIGRYESLEEARAMMTAIARNIREKPFVADSE